MKSTIPAAILALALSGQTLSAPRLYAADAKPEQIRSLEDLVTQFNADQGAPRVVLLLSPT